jgi:arylformamidase
MTGIDNEIEYNNRRRVPEFVEIAARWREASESYRKITKAEFDLPYGEGERHRYDLFLAGPAAPLIVYIHGGYWQRGDRKEYSFLARALNAAGFDLALPSYTLCPQCTVMDIIGEMRQFLVALWRKTGKRPLVTGHSAGGHLTAAMLATDWGSRDSVPADLVQAGVPISGVFDLPPLIGTSINELVHLDDATARAASPLFWPTPPKGRTLVAAVGGAESAEFRRQSRTIAEVWGGAGLTAEYLEVPGTNHFTVVEELTNPASALFERVTGLAGRVS